MFFLFSCDSISLLTAKNPTVPSGFFGGEREHSPYSGNGRVYSHSGACNGEFGGVAVSRNQVMIVQKSLCLVVFSVKAQNELSDLKYTFLVVANNNKMIDYLSKRTIKLF